MFHALPAPSRILPMAALIAGSFTMPASAHRGDYADLAERVSPAVVNIFTSRAAPDAAGGLPENHPLRRYFERFGPQRGGPVEALGSGFIFDAGGYVITNNHVVEDTDSVKLRLSDEREFEATVIGTDPATDIALLKIETGAALPSVTLGRSADLRVGEEVMAVGNPFGLGGTVTTGIVSAKGRSIGAGSGYVDYIQTDAAINRGNSGGPLFNMRGEVIGVNTAIFSPSGGSVGVGFAVPSDTVSRVVAALRDEGAVRRGWLGVQIQSVSREIADAMGMGEPRGALVMRIDPSGPASGVLERGDVIVAFDGAEVRRSRDLPRLVGRAGPQATVSIRVLRDGEARDLTLSLGELKT